MPRRSLGVLYTCCCCGYETKFKTNMVHHFYKLKNPCPKIIANIELTEEIKQYILANRIYKPPEEKRVTQNTTIQTINNINNFNTVNNFISGIDIIEKMTKYTEHKQLDIVPFSQCVEDKYLTKAKRLESCSRNVELKYQDILDIIHDVCNGECKIVEEFNVIYDSKVNTIKLYEQGEWQEMIVSKGIVHIIKIIQEFYLDSYEFFLIRKMKDSNEPGRRKAKYRELLEEYFKFIACFDIDPYYKDKNNNEILFNDEDPRYYKEVDYSDIDAHSIEEEMNKIYSNIRDKITKSEINSIKKEVIDIIKKNTKRGIEEVNKKVLELFTMDETFKNLILKR